MRRIKLTALIVFVVIYIFGCATTSLNKKLVENADTLLIGQIELNATGFHRYGDATVNGTHRANIEIHLQSMKTDKTVIIRSKRPNGYFFLVNPKEDHYRISNLFFKLVNWLST